MDSIADHSAYLLGAMNGSKKRYEGIAGMTDYKKAVQLIKDGGYATSLTYVEKLCSIIEKWNLTQYDVKEGAAEPEKWYRVRKTWADAKSQKGAYKVLKNAKACADKNMVILFLTGMAMWCMHRQKNPSRSRKRCLTVCVSAPRI